jgi:hypothetical protein
VVVGRGQGDDLGDRIARQGAGGGAAELGGVVQRAEDLTFREFWDAYEDMVGRARKGELTMDDYAGTTVSLDVRRVDGHRLAVLLLIGDVHGRHLLQRLDDGVADQVAKAVAANMEASLSVPTATTVRAVPAKLLIDNRIGRSPGRS